MKHIIELTDTIPFKERHRSILPAMVEEVRKHLEDLVASGVVRTSKSPWASAVVLCRKKIVNLRMCIDYRRLFKDS